MAPPNEKIPDAGAPGAPINMDLISTDPIQYGYPAMTMAPVQPTPSTRTYEDDKAYWDACDAAITPMGNITETKRYRANIGWDGGTATYFHMTGHIGPIVVEAASADEALTMFQVMLDAEANADRYEGDVESIDVEEAEDE